MVRVLTYNAHSCVGLDGEYSIDRVAGVVQRSGADVVCLQEVEANTSMRSPRSWSPLHADDQPRAIANAAGLSHHMFVASFRGFVTNEEAFHRPSGEVVVRERDGPGAYGNAVLSRYPILDCQELHYDHVHPPLSESYIFMDKEQQPRSAVAVLLEVPAANSGEPEHEDPPMAPRQSSLLWVVTTHLSSKFASREQRAQARQLLDWIYGLVETPRPDLRGVSCVLCGDLNAPPFLPRSAYSVIASERKWRDLWKERGTNFNACTFPSSAYMDAASVHKIQTSKKFASVLKVGMRIDHIFVLEHLAAPIVCEEIYVAREVEDCEASDHCAVAADLAFRSATRRSIGSAFCKKRQPRDLCAASLDSAALSSSRERARDSDVDQDLMRAQFRRHRSAED